MKIIIINYFASLGSFMGFIIFMNYNNIPAGVLMCILFAICLIWFSDIMKRWAAHVREKRNEPVEEHWNDCRIDIPIDEPVKKKETKSNVRTGSYPSEKYLQMVAEKEAKA